MAYTVLDFSDIVDSVVAELKLDPNNAAELIRIKRDINMVYLHEVVPFKRSWPWLRGQVDVRQEAYYSDGTVAVTPSSTTITFSVAPADSKAGYYFAVDNKTDIFTIATHTAGATTATLSKAYTGALDATATFRLWTDRIALPTDCRETIEVLHDYFRTPLEGVGLQEYRKLIASNRRGEGYAQYYSTTDFKDPSSGTGETESDRYRELMIYPAQTQTPYLLHIDYVKEVSALSDDGDEPAMPVEDRIVLVYGALARAWRRARNEESAGINYQLFQNKLGQMSGRYEDSTDAAQLSPKSNYLADKRGRRLSTGARLAGMSGSGYNVPTYIAGATINGATITGNVTVSNGITIDGRDVSADGALLDAHIADTDDAHDASAISSVASGNLAATNVQAALDELQTDVDSRVSSTALTTHATDTATHGVTGAIVGTASSQTLTNKTIDADSNTITNIENADIKAAAAIALNKLAATTASRSLVSDASGFVSASATTSTEIGYVAGVTSAIQTQLNAKAPSASPTFSGTITTPLTASRAVATGGTSELVASATTSTELGYVSGVTSAIQTQLDGKVAKSLTSSTGDIIYASAANTPARLAIGSEGDSLIVSSGIPAWATLVTTEADDSSNFAYTNAGTVSNNSVWSQRVGNMLIIRGSFTAGTCSAATFSIDISTYTINTTNFGASNVVKVGTLIAHPSASQAIFSTNDICCLFVDTSQNAKLYAANQHGATAGTFNKILGTTLYNSQPVTWEARIPISGW